jgi:hypothetical protein
LGGMDGTRDDVSRIEHFLASETRGN